MSKHVRPGMPVGARPGGSKPGSFVSDPSRRPAPQAAAPAAIVTQEPEPEVTRRAPELTVDAQRVVLNAVEEREPAPQTVEADSLFERVDLPSNFVFYDWSEISLRKLDVFDQAKLARAVKYRSWSMLIDVIQATCNRDVRSLAVSDFYALCVWHKNYSYLQGRSRITYMSMYGNRATGVSPVAVKIVEKKIEKTRAQYLAALDRGLAISTVRDLETIRSNEIDEDTFYLFERGQYVSLVGLEDEVAALEKAGDRCATIRARIAELARRQRTNGLSATFEEIDAFAEEFAAFSIEEIATVRDPGFDAKLALTYLNDTIDESTADAPRYAEFVEERDRIAAALAAGGKVEAKIEEVPLALDPWTMFRYT